MTAYDPQNIFAKILRGEVPNHTVFEDAYCLSFMDIMPQVDGHCLVIPKAPSRGLLDATPDTLSHILHAVQKVAKAAVAAFHADGFQVRQCNESAGGQTVFHLHFHIMPMRHGVPLKPHTGKMADPAVLAQQAEKIRNHIVM